jgi:hypothetical protein
MPAKDIYHDNVRNALIKEGWTITHDPLFIQFDDVEMYIDLGAEKLIAAEKEGQKIAVEVKSFVSATFILLHFAIGQFIDYRHGLEGLKFAHTLYMAVPIDVYETFFMRRSICHQKLFCQTYCL